MAPLNWTLVVCTVVFLFHSCSGLSDCTGVDCPLLDDCMEESLEPGACCPTCLKPGCSCQGYQYYDCISAGYTNGKVPAGEAYLVDFGSTECTCPAGGGRISCRFIPCPEVPRNCIDLAEPPDACPHCLRLGCNHGGQSYESGHSFHMDPCQVCHCPDQGGDLMCSRVPDCSTTGGRKYHANVLPLYTEGTNSDKNQDYDFTDVASLRPTDARRSGRKELRHTTGTYVPGGEGTTQRTPVPILPSTPPADHQHQTESENVQMAEETETSGPTDPGNLERAVPGHRAHPKLQFSPTTSAPENVREHQRQSQTLGRYQEDHRARGQEDNSHPHLKRDPQSVLSREEINECCVAGETWASDHGHCGTMTPTRTDPAMICWSVQQRCCLSWWSDRRCLAGLNWARRGLDCRSDQTDCSDSYEECCSCCALGLRLSSAWGHCVAPRGLGATCNDVLLSCCEGTDTSNHSAVEEKAPPKKVWEGPERQSFSLHEGDEENLLEDSEVLEDVDECQLYEGLLCHHRCINTPGSYRCDCLPGYQLHQDAINCLPVRMDEENRLKEHDMSTADPTPVVMPTTPPQVPDPCEGNGLCAQRCSPVEGRAHCSCNPGFSITADGRTCTDIDECLLSTHSCQADEICTNTVGHFECRKLIVCPAGYSVRSDVCEDIDECSTLSQPCIPGFECMNTLGSYTCQRRIVLCARGYHASPGDTSCLDTDECETGAHRCAEDQLCHNLPGSYRCDCRSGYQYDIYSRMCMDVNECWRYAGRLCAQTCENTPGSYLCSCHTGFNLSSDAKNCDDVNECVTSPCSHECVNVYGSFQCYCRPGFILSEDGLTCTDLDECSQNGAQLCSYKCVNVPGSYKCVCPEHGYNLAANGRSCSDVDECSTGAHNCTTDETCFNVQGGFRCLSFKCPSNYQRTADTRCDRVTCSDFLSCQATPARITFYHLSFQTNILVPALIFRMGPAPAFTGDDISIAITAGNQDGYFSPRKLNAYTGAIYVQRRPAAPRDFLLHVEMKLWRQGTLTTFLAHIHVFITAPNLL